MTTSPQLKKTSHIGDALLVVEDTIGWILQMIYGKDL
jgi:hypothetical protein